LQHYNDLFFVLCSKGPAFEILLLFEFCESTSPLFAKLSIKNPPKITFNPSEYFRFKELADILHRKEDFIAKIEDSDGGHDQGDHKIDIVFQIDEGKLIKLLLLPFTNMHIVFVAIQAVCQKFKSETTHQGKLNDKLHKSIKAFASQIRDCTKRVIFVFATYFSFHVTSATQKVIDQYKNNFSVVILMDFNECIYPFYLIKDKEKLRDGRQVRNLIKLYHKRISGMPAPPKIELLAPLPDLKNELEINLAESKKKEMLNNGNLH